jgi:hypothetical protein
MSEFAHLPRIRVGENFARRDESGKLVETGWIDEDGVEHRDKFPATGKDRIDGTNPAATVPYNQQWA